MQFKAIGIGDYTQLKHFFENQKYRLSAYSFSSIVVWSNHVFYAGYAIEDDALIVANRCRIRPGDSHLLLPISPRATYTPAQLSALSERAEIEQFWYVPREYLDAFGESAVAAYFEISEQPLLEEYLYYTEDLARLKGNRYAGKRNWINRLTRNYAGRFRIEPIEPPDVQECLCFLEDWCREFACAPEQTESFYCEKQATINALKGMHALGLEGILIRIDGAVQAFGISSGLTGEIGVLSFEKARAAVKGLYQLLDNECAKRLFRSYRYINKESDMGLPGLAQSKQSYHPIEKIASYCLKRKN
jgi:hypothetical protein